MTGPLLLCGAVTAWASAFVGLRSLLEHLSPGAAALARYGIAAVVLLLAAVVVRPALPTWRDGARLAAGGVCGIALYNLLLNTGLHQVLAGTAAFVVNGLIVLGTPAAAWVVRREHTSKRLWTALIMAVGGLALIASGKDGVGGPGVPLLAMAALSYIAFTLILKPMLSRYGSFACTVWATAMGVLPLLWWSGDLIHGSAQLPMSQWWLLLYLGVIPGALANLMFVAALERMPVSTTMLGIAALPVIVVVMAWIWRHEQPHVLTMIGGAVILGAIIWGTHRHHEPPPAING